MEKPKTQDGGTVESQPVPLEAAREAGSLSGRAEMLDEKYTVPGSAAPTNTEKVLAPPDNSFIKEGESQTIEGIQQDEQVIRKKIEAISLEHEMVSFLDGGNLNTLSNDLRNALQKRIEIIDYTITDELVTKSAASGAVVGIGTEIVWLGTAGISTSTLFMSSIGLSVVTAIVAGVYVGKPIYKRMAAFHKKVKENGFTI
jgi:hypothetical protein